MREFPLPLSKADLMKVESPARYVGGEFNAVIKEDMHILVDAEGLEPTTSAV